jgi:hypothetical protein
MYIYVHMRMYLHILQPRWNSKQNIEHYTRRPKYVSYYCQRHILRSSMEKEWLCFRGTFSVLLSLWIIFVFPWQQYLREFPTILRYTHNFYFVLEYKGQRLLRAIYVNVWSIWCEYTSLINIQKLCVVLTECFQEWHAKWNKLFTLRTLSYSVLKSTRTVYCAM